MSYFEQLNQTWQDAILDQMSDCDGGARPEVAEEFKEHYAKHLSECEIAGAPEEKDLFEIGDSYSEFYTGWDAAMEKLAKDKMQLISSWVRSHGEFTDYSDLEGEDYPAYIVKESDLSE
jgi:hypothetical protein